MTYAAYLRIYEPVSAFGEADRSRWECELAAAMYLRAHSRWRAFAEFELAN